MNLKFLLTPDFGFEYLGAWHMLNMTLQQRARIGLHLLMPTSTNEYEKFMLTGRSDVMYANPSRAATLIREKGYIPFGRPRQHFDEMVIASNVNSSFRCVEDLRPGCRIACMGNEDIRLVGLRLLEPADLDAHNVQWIVTDSHENSTRALIRGEADVAFFAADTFAGFSNLTRLQLHPLVESAISDIYHVLLLHPKRLDKLSALQNAFFSLGQQAGDDRILAGVNLPNGFEPMGSEEAEFMIDLMDTLRD